MNPVDKLEMQEEADGSAVVKFEDETAGAEQPSQNKSAEDIKPGSRSDADDDHHDDNTPDADPEREAIRVARREERRLKKEFNREKTKESNHLITVLKKQNETLAERLAVLEKRTAGADVARLDKAIEDGNLRLQYARMKVAEATKAGDGEGAVTAQEAWYEARRNVEALQNMKKRASAEPSKQAVPQAPDPQLQKHAGEWMSRNSWYDPNGRDTDSKVAVKIDESLAEEGWDPTSEDYWEELDSRLSKYLPHRYKAPAERQRPRNVVTGSGGEGSATNRPGEFRLSADRVKAIKEAGKWDNPAERQKMIRRYAQYDRELGVR